MDERDGADRVIRVMAEFYDPAHNEYAIPVTQRVMRRLAAEFGYVDNHEARRMRGEIGLLQADNDKLRELCGDMWEYVAEYADSLDAEVHGFTWPTVTHGYGGKVRNGAGAFVGFPDRMRELGIEVSE